MFNGCTATMSLHSTTGQSSLPYIKAFVEHRNLTSCTVHTAAALSYEIIIKFPPSCDLHSIGCCLLVANGDYTIIWLLFVMAMKTLENMSY